MDGRSEVYDSTGSLVQVRKKINYEPSYSVKKHVIIFVDKLKKWAFFNSNNYFKKLNYLKYL